MRSETPNGGGRSPGRTRRRSKPERLLVVDASLTNKLAGRLRERGRAAVAVSELGWNKYLDPDLIMAVFEKHPDAVLVTGDDRMPEEHGTAIERAGATVATVEPWDRRPRAPHAEVPEHLSDEEVWKREVVQRWAHAMARQESRSVRRYSRDRGSKWTTKIRRPQGRLFKP